MSIIEIQEAASKGMLNETISTDSGACRVAVTALRILAKSVDLTPPHAEHFVLVWPDITADPLTEQIHYAFLAESPDGTLYVNPVKAPGFPMINQVTSSPPGRFLEMKRTDKVI